MTEHELYFAQLDAQRIALRNAKRQLWTALLWAWAVAFVILWTAYEVYRWISL